MYKNKFAKKYPDSYPKKIGILPGVIGCCWMIGRDCRHLITGAKFYTAPPLLGRGYRRKLNGNVCGENQALFLCPVLVKAETSLWCSRD